MLAATSLFLGLLFVVPVLTQDAPAATQLAFVGARLIDGTGAAPVLDAVMVVQDGKITAVGTAAASRFPLARPG